MKKVFFSFYIMLIISTLYVSYVGGPAMDYLYQRITGQDEIAKEAVIEFYQKLSKGAFYVIEQGLLPLPVHQWTHHIETLKLQFGYDLAIDAYDKLKLNDDQKKQLRQGSILCIDNGDYLYHQVGDSQMVLSMGPISVIEPEPIGDDPLNLVAQWFSLFLFLALPTAIWMLLFWRRLRKISLTTAAFGNGNFNARADIGKRSALTPIATAFNAMADRIQQLINSHKELTNAVSHELRSPIARIRFGLEMQTSTPSVEKKRRYTQGLLSDVGILEDLVTELLTFARFDREKPRLKFQFQSTTPWLKGLFATIVPDHCRVSCRARFPADNEASGAWFEPRYLGRAVENLLRNAIRHANQQVHLILEDGDEKCFIHVDDDGPGIAEADRKRIFEPFTRLDDSRSRMTGGYGLGLAIVQRIIAWHSGSVSITDSPLGGARFSIDWPRHGGNGCEEA